MKMHFNLLRALVSPKSEQYPTGSIEARYHPSFGDGKAAKKDQ